MVSEKWIKLLWAFIHTEIDRLNEENECQGEELKVGTADERIYETAVECTHCVVKRKFV